jgi:hypothetical protein
MTNPYKGYNWLGALVGLLVAFIVSIGIDLLFDPSGAPAFAIGVGSGLVFVNLGRKLVKRRADT